MWLGTLASIGKPVLPSMWTQANVVILKENLGKCIHICTLKYLAPCSPELWGVGVQLLYVPTTRCAFCVSVFPVVGSMQKHGRKMEGWWW